MWSAEGDVRGGELERRARLDLAPVRNAERDARRAARVSWRDLGAGAFALAVASGTNVAVFVERRGRWHVVARTTVPGDEPVGAITWTPTSDAVVVAVGSNLVVLALASDGDNRGEVHSSDCLLYTSPSPRDS